MRIHFNQLMARLLLLTLAFAFAPQASALERYQCGEYVLSGKLERNGDFLELVLFAKSKNEERFLLHDFPPPDSVTRVDTNVKVLVRVRVLPPSAIPNAVDTLKILGTPGFDDLEAPVRFKKAGACAKH